MRLQESHPSTLVVGFDGSDDDERVAEVAVDIAREFRASVEIVSAVDLASADAPDDGPSHVAHDTMAARVAERARDVEQDAAATCERMRARAGGAVPVVYRCAEGRPHEILRAAGERPKTWVTVGARRARTVLARTVDQVLRRASCPVLVVPDGVSWKPAGVILTGIDAGELDARVLRIAEGVAAALQRRMGVVHVRTSGDDSTMLRVTAHVRDVAPSVSTSATLSVMRVERSIAATLADHGRRVDAALLVVGTHGHRGLERWVLGSTAESLAQVSSTPYLVVR